MNFFLKGDYFNNQFINETDHYDEKIQKLNPANLDEVLWNSFIKYDRVEKVIESSLQGFKKWKTTRTDDRINYLKKYQEILIRVQDDLALAITYETGKPLWEAQSEVKSVI